ncbi:MAG: DUF6653 family protein [Pseudomonadota bacterium]
MDIVARAERIMGMDDDAWARHANPWSVYSRFSCLPLIVLAIWSRVWIGWWCLIPLAAALFWTWYNPRAFAAPLTTDSWASKGVMGERIYLARNLRPIPSHHIRMAHVLMWLSGGGMVILLFGVIVLDPWATVAGLIGTIMPKVWFVDRMVWLYTDMQDEVRSGAPR